MYIESTIAAYADGTPETVAENTAEEVRRLVQAAAYKYPPGTRISVSIKYLHIKPSPPIQKTGEKE